MKSIEHVATIIFILLSLLLTILSIILFASPASAQTTDGFINALSQCESGGKSDITVLDVNGKYSYGEWQFQLGTYLRYGEKYGILPQNFATSDALLLIHNSNVQRAIVSDMLNDGLQDAWYNCAKKIAQKT